MNRRPDHVKQFILAELGAFGSVDGSKRLLIKGRFQHRAFENLLRRYIVEYVLCELCKSVNTSLYRNQSARSLVVKCHRCGASKTVLNVKKGYQARTTSRRAERDILT
jgi:translation initiation factor 2 subunit 2